MAYDLKVDVVLMDAVQNCTNNCVTGIRIFNEGKGNVFPAVVLRVVRSIRVELHVQCISTDLSFEFHFSSEFVKDSFEIFMGDFGVDYSTFTSLMEVQRRKISLL